ncbi:MAG: hypothetical protein ABIG61_03580, partial [Planctomycetota bacterium]
MKYEGKYNIFNPRSIKTYPISSRINKVKLEDLVTPDDVLNTDYHAPSPTAEKISEVAAAIVESAKTGKPVIFFTGAHLIKNGLGPLLIDLVRRSIVTLVAGNGATAIHDFELALIGQTSEYVPQALEEGQFGMAYEFACQNIAIRLGNRYNLGYG